MIIAAITRHHRASTDASALDYIDDDVRKGTKTADLTAVFACRSALFALSAP